MDRIRPLLVVEDDEATRAFLVENLVADGFHAAGAAGAAEGAAGARGPRSRRCWSST